MIDNCGERMPLAPELIAGLKKIGVPTTTTIMEKLGFRNAYMSGIPRVAVPSNGERMVGLARTLRFTPLREDLVEAQYAKVSESPHRSIMESIEPGEVLVVDCAGFLGAGIAGELFTRRICFRGGVGLVVDGAIRDLSAIQAIGLPVYAKGVHGAGIPRALMSVGKDEPICCGGLTVIPGDIILGDAEGVVAIPRGVVEKVVKLALEHDQMERFARAKLNNGASLHEVYPPTGDGQIEFEKWLAEQPMEGPS